MNSLDRAWEAINALGGTYNRTNQFEAGYWMAITHALREIEKLGGMDPLERQANRDTRAETIRDYRL